MKLNSSKEISSAIVLAWMVGSAHAQLSDISPPDFLSEENMSTMGDFSSCQRISSLDPSSIEPITPPPHDITVPDATALALTGLAILWMSEVRKAGEPRSSLANSLI